MTAKQLRFGRFRQKMCDLLWKYECYDRGWGKDMNTKLIFMQAHKICNELVKEYDIRDR